MLSYRKFFKMIRIRMFRNLRPLHEVTVRNKSDPVLNLEKLEQDSSAALEVVDKEAQIREDEIERKRNKSRLRDSHRNILNDKRPFSEPTMWYQGTLSYNRKMYGRYGTSSGFDPTYCWPTKQELADKIEYEKIAFPYTITEAIEEVNHNRTKKEAEIQERQQEIIEKVKQLDQWKKELKNKMIKKEAEALKAKKHKDRLIEEVRSHFGFTVDPKDEKFKEMLEKKEKEQKKATKDAKKKERDAKLIADLLSKKSGEASPKPLKTATENKPSGEDA